MVIAKTDSSVFDVFLMEWVMVRFFIFLFVFIGMGIPAHALELNGKLIQGGLIIGKVGPGNQIILDGKDILVTDGGDFIIGFGRNHPAESQLEVHYPEGRIEKHVLSIKQREYKTQHINGLDNKMVSPPGGFWDRIKSERTEVAKARAHTYKTSEPYFLKGFVWPASGPISGVYGSQRVLNGKPKQPHYGVDVAAPEGAPVTAPADGIIRLAHPDMYYTGKTVIIDHGYGVSSTLMHMSAIEVTEGQEVKQGNLIGAVGSTGRATGAHLDWRMNWFDVRVDPATIVEGLPE